MRRCSRSRRQESAPVRLAALFAAALAAPVARGSEGEPAAYRWTAGAGFTRYDGPDADQLRVEIVAYPGGVVDDLEPYALQPFMQRAGRVRLSASSGPGDERLCSAELLGVLPGGRLAAQLGVGGGESAAGKECRSFVGGLRYFPGAEPFAAEVTLELAREAGRDSAVVTAGVRLAEPSGGLDPAVELACHVRASEFEGRHDEGLVVSFRLFPVKAFSFGLGLSTDETKAFEVGFRCDSRAGPFVEVRAGTDRILGDRVRAAAGVRF